MIEKVKTLGKNVGTGALVVVAALAALYIARLLLMYQLAPGMLVYDETPIKALQSEGWSDVEIVARHDIAPVWWGGCGKDDDVGFDMKGKNAAHTDGTATVCCALHFKGCTIRH